MKMETSIQVLTKNLFLFETVVIERGIIEESLKNRSEERFQTSEILQSENGGYFFEISPEKKRGRMIEFHQNEKKEIMLILFDFDPSTNEYKSTGECLELKFSELDEIVSSSFFFDLFN